MKHLYIVCLFLACLSSYTYAQEKHDITITGHVVDKKTGEHLPYITIFLRGTTLGTATDATGHYFLRNLPEGTFTLQMKSLGYKTIERQVELKGKMTLEVDFEAEEDVSALDEVVVSANRNETSRRLAPTLVSVISPQMFEATNSPTLADGLNFQPGVRVETNCQNCGFTQVRLNGLDGPYTQILIDSRSVFSALTGVYGLEMVPANMIERVEIMRGGGSALFGSSAIAGTINIITKEPLRNTASLEHTLMMTGGSRPDNNTSMNVSLVSDDHRAGIYVFGKNRNRSAYDHDGDGYSEITQIQSKTLGFRSFFNLSTYSKLTFEYHGINEFRRGGNKLNLQPHNADITEQLEHVINGGGLNYNYYSPDEKSNLKIYASAQDAKRKSYYGGGMDPDAYGRTKDFVFDGGFQYAYNWDNLLFMPATTTLGSEFNFNDLEDNIDGYNRHITQTVRTYSAFLQNEWKTDRWSFLIGGRLDKHSLVDHAILSPRANVRYNPIEDINLRLSYTQGFRAPQAYDEDLHISLVAGDPILIKLSDNLKEEKSQSVSASMDYYLGIGTVQTNFLIEGFYTDLKDVFVLGERTTGSDGIDFQERKNGAGARVFGLNLEARAAYSFMQIQGGLTLQNSRYKEPESWSETLEPQKRIFRTPDIYGYLSSTFTPFARFSASVTGTYSGSMLVQHVGGEGAYIPEDREVETPSFWDMNLKLAYDIPLRQTTMQLSAGIQNLFNAYQNDFDPGATRDAGYIYGPNLPRSFFLGCKFSY